MKKISKILSFALLTMSLTMCAWGLLACIEFGLFPDFFAIFEFHLKLLRYATAILLLLSFSFITALIQLWLDEKSYRDA